MYCKTCDKKFHVCSSCGMSFDWEQKYCSQKCWQLGVEHKTNSQLVIRLANSLSDEQVAMLRAFRELDDRDYYINCLGELLEKR